MKIPPRQKDIGKRNSPKLHRGGEETIQWFALLSLTEVLRVVSWNVFQSSKRGKGCRREPSSELVKCQCVSSEGWKGRADVPMRYIAEYGKVRWHLTIIYLLCFSGLFPQLGVKDV